MIPYAQEVIRANEARGWWSKKTLIDYLRENAGNPCDLPHPCWCTKEIDPERIAYVDAQGRMVNWRQVNQMVNRLALGFTELGIKKDDFVVMQIPNSLEFVYCHFALACLGAVTVPVVMPFREHELSTILELSEAQVAIIPHEYNRFNYLDMYSRLKARYPGLETLIIYGVDRAPEGAVSLIELMDTPWEEKYPIGHVEQLRPDANEVVTMCLTSGTEAQLKGVPRTHNNWIPFAHVVAHDAWGRNSSHDVTVMPLPLPNLYGLGCGLYAALMLGQTLVLLERFDPEECARAIQEYRATHFMGVPAMHIALLNSPAVEKYDLGSLRTAITGGAPAPTPMIEEYQRRFRVKVVNGWGSNEGAFIGTRIDQREHVADSIGPHPQSYDIKIVHPETRELLRPGEVGEIAMRGPCIFPGYHKRPDLNARAFDAEGFFYTGDLGMLGLDGYYRFCGRVKDLIIRGGMNISPEEIEFLLQAHPKVLYVAAVGMPDERLGERVCVYIQPKQPGDEITLSEVVEFLKEKGIATFKLPERVEVVEELPRTPTGKVKKYVLREDIARKVKASAP